MNNAALRNEMRARRRALTQQEQSEASRACAEWIWSLPEYQAAKNIMAYVAARGELDLAPVISAILESGRTLLLPLCEGPGVMSARRVRSMEELRSGAYGLLEPGQDCPVMQPEEIDLVLAPGTVFDRHGGRIGQGGGYYDRFLPKTRAARIGVCHDFALVECLELSGHDVSMDAVVTPSGVWRRT